MQFVQLTEWSHHPCWPLSPTQWGMLWNGSAVIACLTPFTRHLTTSIRRVSLSVIPPHPHMPTSPSAPSTPWGEGLANLYQSYLSCLTQCPAQTRSTEIVEQTIDMSFCDIYCSLCFGMSTWASFFKCRSELLESKAFVCFMYFIFNPLKHLDPGSVNS